MRCRRRATLISPFRMRSGMTDAQRIEAYIAAFPPEVEKRLRTMRETIRRAVPDAEERFAYQMPGFRLGRPLLYYGAFQKHVSLFGATGSLREQMPELTAHKGGKGTIQFPHDEPLPVKLIEKVAKVRASENRESR